MRRRRRKKRAPLGSLAILVVFTVGLGYVLTRFLLGPMLFAPAHSTAFKQQPPPALPAMASPGGSPKEMPKGGEEAKESITFPRFAAFFVQVGNFTAKDGAEKQREYLLNNGCYTAVWGEKPYKLFTGGFTSREEAAAYAAALKERGVDSFVVDKRFGGTMITVSSDDVLKTYAEALTPLSEFLTADTRFWTQWLGKGELDASFFESLPVWHNKLNMAEEILADRDPPASAADVHRQMESTFRLAADYVQKLNTMAEQGEQGDPAAVYTGRLQLWQQLEQIYTRFLTP